MQGNDGASVGTAGDWIPLETNTHQDHVIAHVIGATVQGFFTADETACLLLDIGFIWTVYLDGEMGLVPQSMAIAELEVDEETKKQLRDDVQKLQTSAAAATGQNTPLAKMTEAPDGCLITEVNFYSRMDERRLVIECEDESLAIETSLTTGEVHIHPN
jgi:hypothetical protein